MIMDASLWPRRILPGTGIMSVRHGFCGGRLQRLIDFLDELPALQL